MIKLSNLINFILRSIKRYEYAYSPAHTVMTLYTLDLNNTIASQETMLMLKPPLSLTSVNSPPSSKIMKELLRGHFL